MSYTAKHLEAALAETIAKARADVVQSWAAEKAPERRDSLWHDMQAIERLEELLRNDFAAILRRAAGEE